MQVSFLLDENIAAPLADKLDKAGHDVERIVDVSELGEGVDDTIIRQYAVEGAVSSSPLATTNRFTMYVLPRVGYLSNFEESLVYREISGQIRPFTVPITGHFLGRIEIHTLRLSHFVSRHVYRCTLFVDGTSEYIDCTIGVPFWGDCQLVTVFIIVARSLYLDS